MTPVSEVLGAEPIIALAVSADFYPEDTPTGFYEVTLAIPADARFGAGLFELRHIRALTADERAPKHGSYKVLAAASRQPNTGEASNVR